MYELVEPPPIVMILLDVLANPLSPPSPKESNADMTSTYLWYANLDGATLRDTILTNAVMNYASMRNVDMIYADLEDADLKWVDLRNAYISNSNLHGVSLRSADLTDADIQDSNLSYAIFRDSKMHSISFDNVNFTSATFIFAQLTDADVDYFGCLRPRAHFYRFVL